MPPARHHRTHGGERFPTSIRQAPRTHFPEASVTSLSPLVPHSPPTTAPSTVTCCAPSKARWSWRMRETLTWANIHLQALEAKAVCKEWFVDNGQLFVRPWSFDPRLRALSPPFGPPEAAWRMATSRAPLAFFACPSACRSLWDGTRRTSTTPSPSSARTRGPQRWSPPAALASTSTHVPGSRCALATSCAPRLSASTMPQAVC